MDDEKRMWLERSNNSYIKTLEDLVASQPGRTLEQAMQFAMDNISPKLDRETHLGLIKEAYDILKSRTKT
jgi:hypothetical protein